MALIANEILKETPVQEICDTFKCNRGAVQTTQQQALNFSGMMAAFCERLCWTDYSILFLRISEKINWQVKEELLDLMQIPSLRPERARVLYNADFRSIEDVASNCRADNMVKLFAKNDGFVTHRQSNAEDLTLKYEYLYSFSHKVLAEAKAILIKRKFDPDSTANNYLALGITTDNLFGGPDLMMLSDSSSDDSVDEESDLDELVGAIELEDDENSN